MTQNGFKLLVYLYTISSGMIQFIILFLTVEAVFLPQVIIQ
jgi:hypothetical protein